MGRILALLVTFLYPFCAQADVEDLLWDRLDRLVDTDGWELVSTSDRHRKIRCTECEGEVLVTISANTLPNEITDRFTVRQALNNYRITKCRELVQSGEGRCIKGGLAEIKGGLAEDEQILPYNGNIIWGHATWPAEISPPDELRGAWVYHLMKSLTLLY